MRPAGGAWTSVPTQFDGQHLLARFNDAGLAGPYEFQATSCDIAGNCASTSETLALPTRVAAVSSVSFQRIVNPLKAHWVRKRVRVGWHWLTVHRGGDRVRGRVGWHWATINRHGKRTRVKRGGHWVTVHRGGHLARVKRGGHYKTIKVLKWHEQCSREPVKARHGTKLRKHCEAPHLVTLTNSRVRFGRRVTVHGALTTSQDVPVPGAQVRIMTAPDNRLGQFTQASSVTTGDDGSWAVQLPPGPSRIIQAVYDGSSIVLPASGQASLTVPAKIRLRVNHTHTSWGSTMVLTGRLIGGYIPGSRQDLLKLRMTGDRQPHTVGVQQLGTNGRFRISWTFDCEPGVATYRVWVASLSEADYAYAPNASNRVHVTIGPGQKTPPC
jgi:hypothetical protein